MPARSATSRPQLEVETPLLALAAACSVVEEAAVVVGRPLPPRLAVRLAHRARRVYSQSESFRRKVRTRGDSGREWLHAFLRHWLAALLREECPALFRRLPTAFANGIACLPAIPSGPAEQFPPADDFHLSNEARQLIA